MGGYAWASRRFKQNGRLGTRTATALWHSLFFALAGFAVTLIAVLSIESRVQFIGSVPGLFDPRELLPSLAGGLLAGSIGFWRAWAHGGRAENRTYYLDEDLEWAETVFSAIILAALLMYFVVQAFKIPSGSMETTLRIGDHLFVNKFIYGVRIPLTGKRILRFKPVARGDIIVFRFPTESVAEEHCGSPQYGKDFIKRVIGLPGETIELKDGEVFINGEPIGPEPYAHLKPGASRVPRPETGLTPAQYEAYWLSRNLDRELEGAMRDNFGPVSVPPESYLVMGDNRDYSCDSRFWGPVHERYLKGKALVIYWPPSRMGGIN